MLSTVLFIHLYIVALHSLLFQEFGVHTSQHCAPQKRIYMYKNQCEWCTVYNFLVLFCSPYLCSRISVDGSLYCKAFLLPTAGIAF